LANDRFSAQTVAMSVTPAPHRGTVLVGRDVAGRALRVSSHPEHGRVVLSIWQDDRCLATIRLLEDDVPELVKVLTASLLPDEQPAQQHGYAAG
jgi:hypothetical protein